MNRRRLIAGGAGLGAVAACGETAVWAQTARMRLLWRGSANRGGRTAKVIELLGAANPNLPV